MSNRSMWRQPRVWIGIIVSVICLWAIFGLIEPAAILEALRTANFSLLALSGLGILLFQLLRAVRWRFMLRNDPPYEKLFHIQNIGFMFNYLLPARLGEVIRAVLIGNVPPVTVARGLSTMVVERFLDLLLIVTLLPFTLADVETLPVELQTGVRISGFLAVAGVALMIVAANRTELVLRVLRAVLDRVPFLDNAKWLKWVGELLLGLESLTRLRDGIILLLMGVAAWLPVIFAYQAGLRAVGIEASVTSAAFVVCAAALSIAAPSSPGQVGVFHAGVIFALTEILGEPEGPAGAFAFLYHALNFGLILVLGLIGMLRIGETWRQLLDTARDVGGQRGSEETSLPDSEVVTLDHSEKPHD